MTRTKNTNIVAVDFEPEECIGQALYLLQLCQQDLNMSRKVTVWPRAKRARELCQVLESLFAPKADCNEDNTINGLIEASDNTINGLLEARHTAELEWTEPWLSCGPEGNSLTAYVRLRATVNDCINLQRMADKHSERQTAGEDGRRLDEFIAVHCATVVKSK